MKIIIGKGLGPIKFGMTDVEVIQLIGVPDKIKVYEQEVNRQYLEYYDLKMRISIFLDHNSVVGYIESSNPKLEFDGIQIVNAEIDQILSKNIHIPNDWNIEKYHSFDVYSFDEFWFSLYVEYKRVTGIQLGVLIDEEDNYIWNLQDVNQFIKKTIDDYDLKKLLG